MSTFNPGDLIRNLNAQDNIFICSPAFDDNRLRVYANGGLFCLIPTTSRNIEIPSFDSYLKFVEDSETYRNLEKEHKKFFIDMTGNSSSDKDEKNKRRAEFLMNPKWFRALFEATRAKYLSEKESSAVAAERFNQTIIARNHRDFQKHNGTVVCAFEMTAPGIWYERYENDSDYVKTQISKNPECDLVTFSCSPDLQDFRISMIELKCNQNACTQPTSGLADHARDMTICRAKVNRNDYIREILRRLQYMIYYDLLKNVPDGLMTHIQKLSEHPEQVTLCSCFLFTGDDNIKDAQKAAELCQKAEYLRDHLDDFSYHFRKTPKEADLSDMQKWKAFLNS